MSKEMPSISKSIRLGNDKTTVSVRKDDSICPKEHQSRRIFLKESSYSTKRHEDRKTRICHWPLLGKASWSFHANNRNIMLNGMFISSMIISKWEKDRHCRTPSWASYPNHGQKHHDLPGYLLYPNQSLVAQVYSWRSRAVNVWLQKSHFLSNSLRMGLCGDKGMKIEESSPPLSRLCPSSWMNEFCGNEGELENVFEAFWIYQHLAHLEWLYLT